MVAEQKELLLGVMAHSLAAMRDEVIEHLEQKIAAISEEVGLLRADLAVTMAVSNNNNKSGDIIDLPAFPLQRKRSG